MEGEKESRKYEGKDGKKEGKIKLEKREDYKIGFWNVAALENKDRHFWKSLEEWDVIFMNSEGEGRVI